MGTTTDKLQGILDSKADIKDAIEAKGVSVGDAKLSEYAGKIAEISGGGEEEENYDDDVIFIDYDGKVLYRYTAQEFLALEEMPANPSHEGLIAQGWNWTLEEARTYVGKYGMLTIGQMYITDDGKTRVYITLDNPNYLSPTLHFDQNKANGVVINWGDGSSEESVSGTGFVHIEHTYGNVGNYLITLQVVSGNFVLGSDTINDAFISTTTEDKLYYRNTLGKILIGSGCSGFSRYAFYLCQNLKYITTPNDETVIAKRGIANDSFEESGIKSFIFPRGIIGAGADSDGYYMFGRCGSLNIVSICGNIISTYWYGTFSGSNIKRVELADNVYPIRNTCNYCNCLKRAVIPENITKLESSCFYYAHLSSLTIRDNVTQIDAQAFRGINNLEYVSIGSSVTVIGNYNFVSNIFIKEFHIKASTPPTITTGSLPNVSSFKGKIYVPQGSLSAYQTATNWSAYASYMEEEPND